MTTGPDPALVDTLSAVRAAATARSIEISAVVRAKQEEMRAESEQRRSANEELCARLDAEVEQRVAAPRRSRPDESGDGDFGFEEDEDEAMRRAGYTADTASIPHPVPAAAPAPPPVPPARPEPQPRPGRHRRPGADDDDFAHTDWVTG